MENRADGQWVAAGRAGQLVRPGVAGLFAWWRRQLGSLLPDWAVFRASPSAAVIIAIQAVGYDSAGTFQADGQILVRERGQERVVAPLDRYRQDLNQVAESDAIILRLPRPLVLRREIALPLAVERDLRSLIHFQMDQLTPFDASEVYWGVSHPIRSQARLQLTLHVVQRNLIDRLLGVLTRIGLTPTTLHDQGGEIPLPRTGRRNPSGRTARYGACASLGLACLLAPIVDQQLRLQTTTHQLEILRPAQRQIARLQAPIDTLANAQALIGQAQQNAEMLRVLALLSGALPDGTWLTDLTVNAGLVSFDGHSNDAARLISTLTATPGLRNVTFSAPVTRAPSSASDDFSIQLTVSR